MGAAQAQQRRLQRGQWSRSPRAIARRIDDSRIGTSTICTMLIIFTSIIITNMKAGSEVTRLEPPDGGQVTIRPLRTEDATRLRDFYRGLSDHSLRMRFLGWVSPVSDELAEKMADLDFTSRYGFAAFQDGELVADCRLITNEEGQFELAIAAADRLQGRRLGKVLLDLALEAAGTRPVVAQVRYDNERMVRLLRSRVFRRTRWEVGIMVFIRDVVPREAGRTSRKPPVEVRAHAPSGAGGASRAG